METERLAWVDFGRGIALIGMAVYHLCWDMSYFGYIPHDKPNTLGFVILARIVAASFLFLSGFSLVLANQKQIHWYKFFRRLFVIVAAAVLVSAATYLFIPDDFIYFGMLHEIALSSLIGMFFLFSPIIVNFIAFIVILLIHQFFAFDALNQPLIWWLGLSTAPRPAFDFVPFIPWFAAPLAGITTARLMQRFDWLPFLRGNSIVRSKFFITKIGRHSLIIYLLHQPIFLAVILLITLVFPPSTNNIESQLVGQCVVTCSRANDDHVCKSYCRCVVSNIKDQRLLQPFMNGEILESDTRIKTIEGGCFLPNANRENHDKANS